MENKNCTILFHVFICKTKYHVHIVIYVMVLGGAILGGMEIKGTCKSKGTSVMRRTCSPIVESYKMEGKLLITFKTVRIMWNAHKEFPICTFEKILLSLSN